MKRFLVVLLLLPATTGGRALGLTYPAAMTGRQTLELTYPAATANGQTLGLTYPAVTTNGQTLGLKYPTAMTNGQTVEPAPQDNPMIWADYPDPDLLCAAATLCIGKP